MLGAYGERWRVFADRVAGVVIWVVIRFVGGADFEVAYRVVFLEDSALVNEHQFVGWDAEHSADVAL